MTHLRVWLRTLCPVLIAFLATGWLLSRPPAALPAGGFDHEQTASTLGCLYCHVGQPGRGSILASGSAWCQTCHQDRVQGAHPLGVVARPQPALPLDEHGRIGCLTCHSPHRPAFDETAWVPESVAPPQEERYRTHLLLERNTTGQLCQRCHASQRRPGPLHGSGRLLLGAYAGSAACKPCHADIHAAWSLTPHARMTRAPKDVSEFAAMDDRGFGLPRDRVRWVLGSHWVHRFVLDATGTLLMAPGIYDRGTADWLKVKDHGWRRRQWTVECAGCHTTGFDAESRTFVEPGVGCEGCHGPGRAHARSGARSLIVAPARLDADRREMVCESCHTSGIDRTARFHFPVGYRPGDDLRRFYIGLTPKPGQDGSNFLGDESYADRRRQWEFLKGRLFLAQGLTCDYCQNFRSFSPASGSAFMTWDQYCLTCHRDRADHPASRAETPATPAMQTMTASGSTRPGATCVTCHTPRRTRDGQAWSIHDHKFSFEPVPGQP